MKLLELLNRFYQYFRKENKTDKNVLLRNIAQNLKRIKDKLLPRKHKVVHLLYLRKHYWFSSSLQ